MSELEERLQSILSSPEEMGKIIEIAKSLSQGSENITSSQDSFDINSLTKMLSSMGKSEKSVLFEAMLPYIKESRREDFERALK